MFAPGTQLGSYRITGELSRGGMGAVFTAEHALIGRSVAIKVIDPALADEPEAIELFFREARAANRIAHPNIIQVTDLVRGEGDQPTFMVMELLEGETLAAQIERLERLPIERVVEIGEQVADAMQAAHEAGIVHRDLKPGNLFVSERDDERHIKILDFGISNLSDQSDEASLCGTPLYMSPEQARREPTDHRTDIYSLGAVLYEALTGRPVFDHERVRELIEAHASEEPVSPRELGEHAVQAPRRLESLIMRCLEKAPRRRPQSMAELAAELQTIASELQRRGRPRAAALTPAPPTARDFGLDFASEDDDLDLLEELESGREQPATEPPISRGRRIAELAVGLGVTAAAAAMLSMVDSETVTPPARGLASAVDLLANEAEAEPAESTEPPAAKPPRYQLRIETDPAGARVAWRGTPLGSAPVILELDRPAAGELVVTRDGWKPVRRAVEIEGEATVYIDLEPANRSDEARRAPRRLRRSVNVNASRPKRPEVSEPVADERPAPPRHAAVPDARPRISQVEKHAVIDPFVE